jgi:hypothetical protein
MLKCKKRKAMPGGSSFLPLIFPYPRLESVTKSVTSCQNSGTVGDDLLLFIPTISSFSYGSRPKEMLMHQMHSSISFSASQRDMGLQQADDLLRTACKTALLCMGYLLIEFPADNKGTHGRSIDLHEPRNGAV